MLAHVLVPGFPRTFQTSDRESAISITSSGSFPWKMVIRKQPPCAKFILLSDAGASGPFQWVEKNDTLKAKLNILNGYFHY